jgi:hypothetical protein
MNRHQRRAAKSAQDRAWRDSLDTIHQEARGLLALHVVRAEDMLDLLAASLTGDSYAAGLAQAVTHAVADIAAASTSGVPKLCGSCPREIHGSGYSIVLTLAECDDPTRAVGMAICKACGTTEVAIREKATVALRGIWPDLRPITITHASGSRA